MKHILMQKSTENVFNKQKVIKQEKNNLSPYCLYLTLQEDKILEYKDYMSDKAEYLLTKRYINKIFYFICAFTTFCT